MEDNVSDALKMAGAVLLFVIGLAVCMLSFSQARVAIDAILSYSDRESATIENDSRYYYLSNENDTNRYVGIETIIPAIYRAYKERYKIVFKFPDDYYLFCNKNDQTIKSTKIDLEEQSIASDQASRQFLNGIVYGKWSDDIPGDKNPEQRYIDYFKIIPNSTALYKYLTNKESNYKIKESLGTFYIEDLNQTSTNVQDVNKTEKRVITYEFITK